MTTPDRIVVVGASLGGQRAVTALRRGGFAGALTLVGAETHLPYDRPPLSKQVLLGKWEASRTALAKPEDIEKLNLDLRLGRRAVALNAKTREVELDDGARLGYDALIIATGATPIMLRGVAPLPGVHVLRTLDDSLAIRAGMEQGARVAIVGGGFIGAEVASAAAQRGLAVTILEALSQPLERALGPRVGEAAAALQRQHGVDVRCGVTVTGIEGEGRVERVRLGDGSAVEADPVVVGVGVRPETAWLESSGITLRDGVVCDRYLESSLPGVYAIGDLCRWPNELFDEEMRVEHWTNAVEQAMAAAKNILAPTAEARKPYAAVPYVWSDQYDVSIQYVGHGRGDDELVVKHGSIESGRLVALYGRAGRLVAAVGFSMFRELGDYRRLIANRATLAEAIAHVVEDEDE